VKRLAFLPFVLAGCALLQPADAPLGPGEVTSASAARAALIPGKSTKAEVRAALGEAIILDFDSGYEVWVYRERLREKHPPPPGELVLLFEPSGILAKARVRD
jgi:hypothetical protein